MKKRKLFLIALTLIMSTCFLFAFVGCNKDSQCTHEWQNTSVRTDATCTEVGSQEQKCTKCGDTQTIELPVLGHNTDGTITHKDADCTNDGIVGGTYCTRCNEGKAAAEATITALGHNYGETSYFWNDDYTVCTATHACKRVGCTDEVEGHTETATATRIASNVTQVQTCENPELTTYTAMFGVAWAETQTKADVQTKTALGHIDENKDHICDRKNCGATVGVHQAAEGTHVCDYCNQKASEHMGGTATCQKKAICTVCGNEYGELANHNVVLDTTQGVNGYTWATDYSSCTAHGKCDRMGCTHTIDATATVTPSKKQAQSCVNAEIYDYTATFTEAWAETQTKENVQTNTATGHNYGAITIAWNDDYTAFIATRTCSNCTDGVEGHTQTATSTWHDEYVATTLPTCTEAGVADYTVVFDVDWIEGDQTISAIAPAYGHDYTKVNHDDTHHWKECYRCHLVDGATKVEHTYNQTVAIDKYLATSATCQAKATYYKSCECGAHGTETFESGDFADHNYSLEWTIDKSANCTEDGSKSHHCLTNGCDSKSDVTTIPSLGHNIVLDTTKGVNGYTWASDYSSCTAHGKCDRKGCTHTEDAKAILSLNTIQGATCTLPEKSDIDYSFSVSWVTGGRMDLVQTGPALGHHIVLDTTKGVNGYTWATDYSSCTAHGKCDRTGCTHTVDANATVTPSKKQAQSCVNAEIYDYTATFTETWSETQTKADIQTKDALGHKLTKTEANNATCETDGNRRYWTCETCKKIYTDENGKTELTDVNKDGKVDIKDTVDPAFGHWYLSEIQKEEYLKTAATCEENAVYYKSCVSCGKSSEGTPDEATFIAQNTALGHIDENKDHVCDRDDCTEAMGTHVAAENSHICDYCKQKASDHTGGTATCKTQAECTVCHEKYGDLDSTNHEKGLVWTKTATTHKHTYECCGAVSVAEEAHEWENGVCSECEYVCKHTGGTATCKTQAECSVCHEKYGDLDSTNHEEGLVWTRTATTHKHTYECCGAVSVAEEAHEWENGVCTECGDYDTYGTEGIGYAYDSKKETYYVEYYNGDSTEVSIARYQYDEDTGLKPVTYIHNYAFASKSITKVVIPNTVTRIESCAFDCSKLLEEIVFPDTIEYIGNYAFYEVPAITSYVNAQPDGDVYIGKVLYTYKGTMPNNYTLNVKAGTTSISAMAYKEQYNLSAISMPSSLKEIGYETFNSCTGLTGITFGENVILVEESAFADCSNLETITFNSKLEVIENNAFSRCNSIKSLTIPENVTTIGEYAFGYMDALESVTVEGAGLTSLDYSFNDCEELTSITFDISLEALKVISDNVWYCNCPKLTVNYSGGSFKVHYAAKTATCTEDGNIEYWYNFIDGKNYSSEYFSSSSVIEGDVVISASGHTGGTATCQQKATCTICGDEYGDLGDHDFDETTWVKGETSHYHVCKTSGCGKKIDEADHTYGDDDICTVCSFDKNVLGTEGLTYAYNTETQTYTVTGYTGTKTEVYIPETYDDGTNGKKAVTVVGENAFQGKTDIVSIYVPNSVTEIACGAFNGCSSLTTITIPFVGAKAGVTANDTYQYPFGYIFGETAYEGGVSTAQTYYGKSTSSKVTTSYYIPESLTTVNVTGGNILYGAFYQCEHITDVVLPDGLTTIGEFVFYLCKNLKNVTIPNSVTSIGQWTFQNCRALESITLPSGLTRITTNLFSDSGLKSIVIPESVTVIERWAFGDCKALASISIPNGISEIGDSAFLNCSTDAYTEYDNAYYLGNANNPYLILETAKDTSITSCMINAETKIIQSYAFKWCSLSSVTIPNGVESILLEAFYECENLTSVTIPDSVKTIGQEAFYKNTSLTQVTMGSGVKEIGDNAFRNCSSLNCVDISDVAAWLNISFSNAESNPLYYAKNLYLNGTLLEDLVVPNGITEIKKYAFYNTTCLKTVNLPVSITSIGDTAFYGCSNLNGLYITDIVAWVNIDMGNSTQLLFNAKNLYLNGTLVKDLVIPENKGITEIKGYAFEGATCLKSVTIPEGVTSIGTGAFWGCRNLETVSIPNSLTTIGNDAFYSCNNIQGNQYDNAKYLGNTNNPYLVLYKAMDYSNITTCDIHKDTKIILSGVFSGCSNLAEITIPDGVTAIQSSAFRYCTELTSIVIPDSVKTLGNAVFENCTKLTSVTFGNGLTSLGNYVFHNCTELQSIVLPDCITVIPMDAFNGCTKLTSVTFGKNVTEIGAYAFKGCTALTSMVIPDTITEIGYQAFYGCTELSSITLSKNLTRIAEEAFNGCSKLAEVVIPESLDEIDREAFYGCTGLTTITLHSGITYINYQAFYGCTSLTTINYEGAVKMWHDIGQSTGWNTNTGEYTVVCTDGTIYKADS